MVSNTALSQRGATMRKRLELHPRICHLLEQMALITGRSQSEIVEEAVIYFYAVHKALPPELADLLRRTSGELSQALACEEI